MRRLIKLGALAAASAALTLASPPAPTQDFPTLKGDNARTGRNAAPGLNGPGRSFLRWWRPNALDAVGSSVVVDNVPTSSGLVAFTGAWGHPASVADEANNPFISDPDADPTDPDLGAAYRFAFTTESLDNSDPTVPETPGNHATWTWTIAPSDGVARNYALYVWLPIGPTIIGGNPFYQGRYFVYEILYGNGQRFIDVVDTFLAGTSWVRLGGGGRNTNALFSYNGVSPIQIRLHNTVPRNDDNKLMDSAGTTLVYADAVRAVPDIGFYTASPTVAQFGPGFADIQVIAALNRFEATGQNGETGVQAEVWALEYDSASGGDNTRWRYAVSEASLKPIVFVDNDSPDVTVEPGWTLQVAPAVYQGANYLSQPITDDLGLATGVLYAPTLADGEYEIWVWLPQSGGLFGQHVRVEVLQGATVTPMEVNQDRVRSNWVRLGGVRFNHSAANPLRVRITNFSPFASDLGRLAFADAVRFVPAGGGVAVHSTPVQAVAGIRTSPGGPVVDTSVVLVAGEDGRIRCLDATGNGDGTTNVYWTYPSTPDPNDPNWSDPNQVAAEDGPGPTAEMPTGFDLSTALVQRIGGEDFLFVGTRNGRVYCIEMAGRGDFNFATRLPGTTRRRWTYPNDFPATKRTSLLGPITGSVAFAIDGAGRPTVYVPASQGRIYALDAVGNANKTTDVRWTYPALSSPTLGPILGTPVVDFGNVYFGTLVNDATGVGEFYALDDDTGNLVWSFPPPGWLNPTPGHFASGAITIPDAQLASAPDLVVAANDNGWIFAFNAQTGAVEWMTDELESNVVGSLTYTPQTVYNNVGALFTTPCVIVPTTDGRLASLFAETAITNVFGGRLAWGFDTDSGAMTASAAVGRNWMYAADQSGYLYAFNDNPAGPISPGNPPGQTVIPPNDPLGIPFREAELKFITKETYEALRLPSGAAGHLSFAQANDPARHIPSPPAPGYEWGETIYMMVYKFPYEIDTNPIPPGLPPTVEFRINVEGSSVRNLSARAKQLSAPASAPISGTSGERLDGYAVISFTLQGSGSTAVPPGLAQASATISAQFEPGARQQNVSLNPALVRKPFNVNNPLAVSVKHDAAGNPLAFYHIGHTIDRYDPEAQVNGSPDISTTPKLENLLLASTGAVAHTQTGGTTIGIWDRSLMRLIRGPNRGLDQVRVNVANLHWQGGIGAIFKPINQLAYPGTEDYPVNFPNDSLDYPDIARERVSVIKEPFGNTENPLLNAIALNPPVGSGPVFDPDTRILMNTPTAIEVAVPRFQPANLVQVPTSEPGSTEPGGYLGRFNIWVDSTGDGQLNTAGRREAFRSIRLGTSVTRDQRIVVSTPTVDLGSLAHGTGYTAGANPYPWNQPGSPFTPNNAPYTTMFQPFEVENWGNVNLLNLRLAKATREGGGAPFPWGLFAPANHERSWLDTIFNLWSDIDATFAFTNPLSGLNNVILQKARVGDVTATSLSVNPRRRENPNIPALEGFVYDTSLLQPGPARVGVTVPIGFPVGTYVTTLRVIEDDVPDEALQLGLLPGGVRQPTEPYSDPGFTLRFNVRESRLTNTFTPLTAPMVHDLIAGGETFIHQSAQPAALRDLNGNLTFAYASTMSDFNQAQPATERLNDEWRIYITTLVGMRPDAATGPFGQSLLPELNAWSPGGGGRYFRQEAGPYPTTSPDSLFQVGPGESVLPGTAKFGAPGFPLLGAVNPYTGAVLARNYMVYLGEAQIQTPGGRRGASRPFISAFTVAANGAVTMEAEHPLPSVEGGVKGRPAVVATDDDEGTVFFAAGGVGQTQIYHLSYRYNGLGGYTETPLRKLDLGAGFESLGSPSVHARVYEGASVAGLPNGARMMELTFTGKLRGRPHADVFFARLRAGGTFGGPTGQVLALPPVVDDRLRPDGEPGVYRALGVNWVPNATVRLEQVLGGTRTDLEVPGSRDVDRITGLIQIDTRLGGKAYLDPNLGVVRFAGAIPARDAILLLSYTPRAMRVSAGDGAAYSSPTGLFDSRYIGEFSYWAFPNNTPIVPPGGSLSSEPVRTGRYVFLYGRAAAGAGQAARPYMRTFRLGVQLPLPIHTQPNGAVTAINVTNATSYFQVDPANGRVYFTAADENRLVSITYTPVDEATGNALPPVTLTNVPVRMILERNEAPLPIEQAINEGQVYGFIDPFDHGDAQFRRPGLIWLFWTSTRAGGPDVYFQTIAPKFTPAPVGRG